MSVEGRTFSQMTVSFLLAFVRVPSIPTESGLGMTSDDVTFLNSDSPTLVARVKSNHESLTSNLASGVLGLSLRPRRTLNPSLLFSLRSLKPDLEGASLKVYSTLGSLGFGRRLERLPDIFMMKGRRAMKEKVIVRAITRARKPYN